MDKTELLLQLVKLLIGDTDKGGDDDSEVSDDQEADDDDDELEQDEPSATQDHFTKNTDQKPVVNTGSNGVRGGQQFPAGQARQY